MSSVVKTVFGGTDKSAQKISDAANREVRQFARENHERSRQESRELYGEAGEARRAGMQQGMQTIGQSLEQQYRAMAQGAQRAQRQLQGGGRAFQQFLTGRPVNRQALMPIQTGYNPFREGQGLEHLTNPTLVPPQQAQPDMQTGAGFPGGPSIYNAIGSTQPVPGGMGADFSGDPSIYNTTYSTQPVPGGMGATQPFMPQITGPAQALGGQLPPNFRFNAFGRRSLGEQ